MMAGRIRSIKPEWLLDERMSQCSSDARVLSIALILMADDYGNGRHHKAQAAPSVFPPSGDSPEELVNCYRRLEEAMAELVGIRFVGLYEDGGQHYFAIRKWAEHQKVSHPGKPLVPGPPENLWKSSGGSPETVGSASCLIGSDLIRSDLKGLEQNGSGSYRNTSNPHDIPCPKDLRLTDDQRGALETALIPGWAIDAITTSFVVSSLAGSNPRPLDAWRKCLAKAVASNWNDPKRRPKKPELNDKSHMIAIRDDGWVREPGETGWTKRLGGVPRELIPEAGKIAYVESLPSREEMLQRRATEAARGRSA